MDCIHIGKSYIEDTKDQDAKLCAHVTINGTDKVLWYKVPQQFRDGLSCGRGDAFVTAMIRFALETGLDIRCDDPVSSTLLYCMNYSYILALTENLPNLKPMKVYAEATDEVLRGDAVGTGCSLGVDSLYTVYRNKDGLYPLTHLVLLNAGTFEEDPDRIAFRHHFELVKSFAEEEGLTPLAVDTNLHEMLPDRYLDVYTARQMSCVLALSNLFSVYLYSAGHRDSSFNYSATNCANYDPLTIESFSTESVRFFLTGADISRARKVEALCDYSKAYRYVHPCFRTAAWEKNCGKCTKCLVDMLVINALGKEREFSPVFDFDGFEKKLSVNLATLMVEEGTELNPEAIDYWTDHGKTIPQKAYVLADVFRRSMDNLRDEIK